MVYLGLGSMPAPRPQELVALAEAIVEKLQARTSGIVWSTSFFRNLWGPMLRQAPTLLSKSLGEAKMIGPPLPVGLGRALRWLVEHLFPVP